LQRFDLPSQICALPSRIRFKKKQVVTRFTIDGTHKGELMGVSAAGRKFKVSGMSIIRFEQGKAVEEWIEEDGLGLMRQLGVVN
jgi:predicted ester cyclase